jgi:hypothetical protein
LPRDYEKRNRYTVLLGPLANDVPNRAIFNHTPFGT